MSTNVVIASTNPNKIYIVNKLTETTGRGAGRGAGCGTGQGVGCGSRRRVKQGVAQGGLPPGRRRRLRRAAAAAGQIWWEVHYPGARLEIPPLQAHQCIGVMGRESAYYGSFIRRVGTTPSIVQGTQLTPLSLFLSMKRQRYVLWRSKAFAPRSSLRLRPQKLPRAQAIFPRTQFRYTIPLYSPSGANPSPPPTVSVNLLDIHTC